MRLAIVVGQVVTISLAIAISPAITTTALPLGQGWGYGGPGTLSFFKNVLFFLKNPGLRIAQTNNYFPTFLVTIFYQAKSDPLPALCHFCLRAKVRSWVRQARQGAPEHATGRFS